LLLSLHRGRGEPHPFLRGGGEDDLYDEFRGNWVNISKKGGRGSTLLSFGKKLAMHGPGLMEKEGGGEGRYPVKEGPTRKREYRIPEIPVLIA